MYGATISYKQTEFVERSKNLVYNRNFSNAIHMCVYIYIYVYTIHIYSYLFYLLLLTLLFYTILIRIHSHIYLLKICIKIIAHQISR